MRVLISLVLTLIVVGTGYWIFTLISRPAETAVALPQAPPVLPTPQVQTPRPSPAPPTTAPVAAATWSDVEKRILELTNQARRQAHAAPLAADDGLHACATAQSNDMLERNFFDHVNPSGEDPSDRVARIHRQMIGTTGENIWKGGGSPLANRPDLADKIFADWMHSPHHRENILRPEFTHLGVGVAIRGVEIRATQSFGKVRAFLDVPLPATVPAGSPVDLRMHGRSPLADEYMLAPLRGSHQSDAPAWPVQGARFTSPGKFRLKFPFPDDGSGSWVFNGPSVNVTN
jgi:uncharacterized protein YkwD